MANSEKAAVPVSRQQMYVVWMLVATGILASSSASIFIKLCNAPPLVIAAYRLTIASIIFIIATLIKEGAVLRSFSAKDLKMAFLSGVFLCIHFATWIASLSYTSVASSVVFLGTSPIFVALGSYFILKEKLRLLLLAGIVSTIVGGILMGSADAGVGDNKLFGDVLAIIGAVGLAGYWLAGRHLRSKIGILPYVSVVYSAAAVLLILLAVISGGSFYPYPPTTFLYLLLIAIVPQVIGHTSFNFSLRFLSAPVVSALVLGEPIGATILAYFILDESISSQKAIGACLVLVGVYFAARGETSANG